MTEEIKNCKNCGPQHLSMWKKTSRGLRCIECIRRVQRNNYALHIDSKRTKSQNERKRNGSVRSLCQKQNMYAFIDTLKAFPCKDCDLQYEPECMDFDHIRKKIYNISRLVQQRYSKKFILQEIEKCELVCVLCHRLRTYKRTIQNAPLRLIDPSQKQITARAKREYKKKIVNTLKLNPCSKCGNSYESCQMDFDHIDPDSKFEWITNLVRGGYSIDILQIELDKCRLLCALCHRRQSSHKNKQLVQNA